MSVWRWRLGALAPLLALAALAAPRRARAHNPEEPEDSPRPGSGITFIDHAGTEPFWFSGQANSIFQVHPHFPAAYSGTNSFQPQAEAAISGLLTAYLAYRPWRVTELIFDAEMALGGGLSSSLGLAGFPNLDVVRNPTLSNEPYLARAQIHQIIPLSSEWERNDDRSPITTFDRLPRHRLELRFGSLSTADIFDINPAGSDSHMQFMNWAMDNNGAFDYAANTRGYTYGLVVEYQGPIIEARFAEMLLPKVANGMELDFDLARQHSENLEMEIKYSRRPGWRGTVRALSWFNTANMGLYQVAIDLFRAGVTPIPDIAVHPFASRLKYGFGLNVVQDLDGVARLFARGGWNSGKEESWCYTEIDDTFAIGFDLAGSLWRRPADRSGLALATNGISEQHREYLRLGGHGFILGDGDPSMPRASNLTYARETIVEWYYTANIWRGAFAAPDIQFIANPGYNHVRGPVWVFGLRAHLEF